MKDSKSEGSPALPHDKNTVYSVSFKTKEVTSTGHIKCVNVTLFEDVMDMEETARIDLADSPLYVELERYVLSNPSGKLNPDGSKKKRWGK